MPLRDNISHMFRICSLFLLLCALAACATNSARSPAAVEQPVAVLALKPTVFSFDGRYEELYLASPLNSEAWQDRMLEARVPVFAAGTHIGEVVSVLQDWNLRPQVSNAHIFVVEGPSRHNFYFGNDVDDPSMMVYAFDDYRMYLGPLNTRETILQLVEDGLSEPDLSLLAQLEKVGAFNATSLNEIGWSLATHNDVAYRDGEMAIGFAKRANVLSEWSSLAHLDTLAAAFAINGDFEKAVIFQEYALILSKGPEDGVLERLNGFKRGEAYIQSDYVDPVQEDAKAPAELLAQAEAGDAQAQYDLAVFYLEAEIEQTGALQFPGKHWLEIAANNGHEYAIDEVGYGLLNGTFGFDFDPAAARPWLLRAAELESDKAAYNLGRMYRDAVGVKSNDEQTAYWFELAAERGIGVAALEMSFRYREGAGVSRSKKASRHFFDLAVAAEVDPVIYLFDNRFLEDAVESIELEFAPLSWQESAAFPAELMQIVAIMQRQVDSGQHYIAASIGDHVYGWPADHAPDVIAAVSRVAAILGSKEAQLRVAEFYESGSGVETSVDNAQYWRQRASRNKVR